MNNDVGLRALRGRLEDPCFENIPLKGIEKKVGSLPPGSDVAITCSPDKGIPAILDLTRSLRDRGFTLRPHIAARMVADGTHLRNILMLFDDLGVHRIFVIGGDAERAKLLRIALKIGVGQSARFLKSNLGLVGWMIKPGGYSPDELLLALASFFDTPLYKIEGVHFYTFNQIESTERWRAEMLARLGGRMDPRP